MLTIERSTFAENYEIIILKHEEKAINAGVIPGLGGMLNNLNIDGFEVVDGVTLDQNGIADYMNTYKSALLLPYPNRIDNGQFNFNGQQHQLHCNETALNNALHGFMYNQHFEVVDCQSNETESVLRLLHEGQGNAEGYPYPFKTELLYKLDATGKLICSCKIENTGSNVLPLGLGWHPYFSMNQAVDELQLEIDTQTQWVLNEKMIPTGETVAVSPISGNIGSTQYDHCFTLDSSIVKLKSSKGRQLSIDCGSDFPYLQVYTPPHRNCIAIEPMTCPPDVYNNGVGLIELAPGEEKQFSFSMTLN